MSLTAQKILESPDYYPLKFEGPNLMFVKMSRESYHQSIFTLPNRIVCAGPEQWSVPFSEVLEIVESANTKFQSPACVFQVAHCGSTLLSRALDQPDSNLVIREPFILRQFAATPVPVTAPDIEYRHRGLAVIWHLLSRQYKPSQKVLVKANVPVNFAISEILEGAPDTRGILLYTDFSGYLLSILKADERRQWAQHVVRELMPRIKLVDAFAGLNFDLLSAAQSAAVLWASQIRNFEAAANLSSNLCSLSSDRFFEQPATYLSASAEHLGIILNREQAKEIAASELFNRHAKLPEQEYSEHQRQRELRQLDSQYGEEIKACLSWLDQTGIDLSHNLAASALG